MERITTVIVDDEPLAREGLSMRLLNVDDIDVVGEYGDGVTALDGIVQSHPNAMFLDIEMPGLTGLEMLEAMHKQGCELPYVIFVTAYKDFALDAFQHKAVDYLLKPYTDERLQECLDKLRLTLKQRMAMDQQSKLESLLGRRTGKSLDGFIKNLETQPQLSGADLQQTISLKSGTEWIRLQLDCIDWIEAAGDYMCVHTGEGSHIIRKTLKQFEKELDPKAFPRVNRSAMVNLNKVVRLSPNSNGEYIATLTNGSEVKVSRKYKFKLDELRPDN